MISPIPQGGRPAPPGVLRALVLLVVLGMLAACGSHTANEGDQPPQTENAPPAGGAFGETGPPPMPDRTPVREPEPSVVAPVAGSARRPVQWRLVEVASGGRHLILEVQVGGPPCDVVTAVDVVESAAQVTVTVRAGAQRGAQCGPGLSARLGVVRVRATLAEQLGTRRLVDGG